MVSVKVVSRYTGTPPRDGEARAISGGPLYPVEEVLGLLKNAGGGAVCPWTRKCIADLQQLALDGSDLVLLLRETFTKGRFLGAEWCQQKPDGPWAASDAYVLTRQEWVPTANRNIAMAYYLKFAIGKSGVILLLVSCHLST